MALKFIIDSLEGIDDGVKSLYEKKGDKYQLKVDGIPQGDDTDGLKKKVDELLAEKKEAKRLQKEAEEKAAAAADEAARKSGDVTALERSWQAKLDKVTGESKAQIDSLTGNINEMLVEGVAVKLASEMAVQGSAAVLIPHIRSRLAAEQRDGKFVTVIKDKDGKPSASTLDDLKNEFAGNAAFAPLIVGSKATGGGAAGGGSTGGGAAKSVSRAQFEQFSPQQRMDHSKAGGTITD